MENVLDMYGINLAKAVQNGLPTMELDLDIPVRENVSGGPDTRLLGFLVYQFFRHNHVIFISDPIDISESYVNTLSLAFQNPSNYFKSIFKDTENSDKRSQQDRDHYFQACYDRFGHREILQIDIERIVTEASGNPSLWDDLINDIEKHQNQHTFALKNLSSFYNAVSRQEPYFRKFDVFWSPYGYIGNKERVSLASMDWENYNKHIEGGQHMRRTTVPISLTPRPLHLTKYRTTLSPDYRFKFDT